jgi:hypothetical protein
LEKAKKNVPALSKPAEEVNLMDFSGKGSE